MSLRDELYRDVNGWQREDLVDFVVNVKMRAEDKKRKEKIQRDDLRLAEEMKNDGRFNGVDWAVFVDMRTVLDAEVRVPDDDGTPNWKHRDEACSKEHHAHNEWVEGRYVTAAGIRRRKDERLHKYEAEHPDYNPAEPIGPYLYGDTYCSICEKGWRKNDPFEIAHETAVAFGGGDIALAHRSCNRAEGVG